MRTQRRYFTTEFKWESACLVIEQGYTVKESRLAMGRGETALRRWVAQLKFERQGITPKGR